METLNHMNEIIVTRQRLYEAVREQGESETIGHWANSQRKIDNILSDLEVHNLDQNREWQNALNIVQYDKVFDGITSFG
jgi:hypothetical protein